MHNGWLHEREKIIEEYVRTRFKQKKEKKKIDNKKPNKRFSGAVKM